MKNENLISAFIMISKNSFLKGCLCGALIVGILLVTGFFVSSRISKSDVPKMNRQSIVAEEKQGGNPLYFEKVAHTNSRTNALLENNTVNISLNKIPVSEAIHTLENEIEKLELKDPPQIKILDPNLAQERQIAHLVLKDISLEKAIWIISMHGNMDYTIADNSIIFFPRQEYEIGKTINRKILILDPNFYGVLEKVANGEIFAQEAVSFLDEEFPTPPKKFSIPQKPYFDMTEFFIKLGIPFSKESMAYYIPGNPFLYVKNESSNFTKLLEFLDKIYPPPISAKYQTNDTDIIVVPPQN